MEDLKNNNIENKKINSLCDKLENPACSNEKKREILYELSHEIIAKIFGRLIEKSKDSVLKNCLELIDDEKLLAILGLLNRESLGKIQNFLDLNELRKIFSDIMERITSMDKITSMKKEINRKIVETIADMFVLNSFLGKSNEDFIDGMNKWRLKANESDDITLLNRIRENVESVDKEILKALSIISIKKCGEKKEVIGKESDGKNYLLNSLNEIRKYSDGDRNLLERIFFNSPANKNDLNNFKLFEKMALILSIQSFVNDGKISEYKDILRGTFMEVMLQCYHVYANELVDNEPTSLELYGKKYEGKNCRRDLDEELHKKYQGIKQFWLLSSSNKRKQTEKLFVDEANRLIEDGKNKEHLQKEFGEIFDNVLDNVLNNYDGDSNLGEILVGNLMRLMVSYRYIVFDKLGKDFIEYVEKKYVEESDKNREKTKDTKSPGRERKQPVINSGPESKIQPNSVESGQDSLITIWGNEHPEESEKLDKILNTLTVNDDVRKRIKKYIVKAKLNKGNIDENTLKNCMKKFNVKLPIGDVICIFEGGEKTPESKGLEPESNGVEPESEEMKSESGGSDSTEPTLTDSVEPESVDKIAIINKFIELLETKYDVAVGLKEEIEKNCKSDWYLLNALKRTKILPNKEKKKGVVDIWTISITGKRRFIIRMIEGNWTVTGMMSHSGKYDTYFNNNRKNNN